MQSNQYAVLAIDKFKTQYSFTANWNNMYYILMIAIALSITQIQSAEQPIIHVQTPPPNIIINNHLHSDNKLSLDNKVNVQQQTYSSNTSTNVQNMFTQARDKRKNIPMAYFHG